MKKETSQSPGSAQDRKMSKGELISYGLGGVASTMPSQFKTSYAMNFMSDVAGLHVGAVGILSTIMLIWDASNDLIIGLMKEKIAQAEGGVILDGFPRTVEQADALDQQLQVDLALNLDVPDEELINRLTKRRSCPDCNAVYHLIYNPPKAEGVCDKCGAKLYQRDDDKEETVANRLKVYRENTMPLIGYYEKKGVLVTIKGVGSIDDIYAQVEKAVQ